MDEHLSNAYSAFYDFTGRAPRAEFWYFILYMLIAGKLLQFFSCVLPAWVVLLGALAIVLPFPAVLVRRIRDTGRSLWWLLSLLIPPLGIMLLLLLAMCPSKKESINTN